MGTVGSLRLVRPLNPLVRVVLGSPAHRLLSGRLVVLTYSGHRSGRRFRIPLRYAETRQGTFVAVAVEPTRKLWWRSFSPPWPASLTVRRRHVWVRGRLAEGEARVAALEAYRARFPRSERFLGDAAIVVFTPNDR